VKLLGCWTLSILTNGKSNKNWGIDPDEFAAGPLRSANEGPVDGAIGRDQARLLQFRKPTLPDGSRYGEGNDQVRQTGAIPNEHDDRQDEQQ
jgi:hypothetical protein